MVQEKALLWQQRIQECMSSGLSIKKWCEENSVSKATFYSWKKRLKKEAEETSAANMPVFAEVTPTAPLQIKSFSSSLHISWKEMHFDITSKEEADLAAYFIRQMQHLC